MITITCPGLDELQKKLADQGKTLTKSYDSVIAGLCDEARQVAEAEYDTARDFVRPDEYEKVEVYVDKIGECDYLITARGKDVCFYEFGAGFGAEGANGLASEMPFGVYPGSWSEKDKRQFVSKGYWFSPQGHYYKLIPSTRAMFKAAELIKQRIANGDFK